MASQRQPFCTNPECPLEFVNINKDTPSWMVLLAFMTRNHQRPAKGSPFNVDQLRTICKEIGIMSARAYEEMYKIFDAYADMGEFVSRHERDETILGMKQLMTAPPERSSASSSTNVTVESVSQELNGMSMNTNDVGRRNGDIYAHEGIREAFEPPRHGIPPEIPPVPPSASVSASSDRTDSIERIYEGACERVDFANFFDEKRPFLAMTKTEGPVNEAALKTVKSPLGVCYDPVLHLWAVADQGNDRVYMLPTEQCIFEDTLLIRPSAVCVVKAGVSMAILCESTILLYIHENSDVAIIYQQARHQYRGIAATPAGNLITISRQGLCLFDATGSNGAPLKVFSFTSGRSNASFLDSYNSKVVVTDLGSQSVFLCHLDDTKSPPEFELIKTHQKHWYPEAKEPDGGFRFVSGVHFDKEGRILIADADGHTYSLFDSELNFLYRVATDFVAPYTSGFTVSPGGLVLIADRKASCLVFCRLTSHGSVLELQPFGGGGNRGFPPGNRGFAPGRGGGGGFGGFRGGFPRGGRGGH